MSEGLVDRQVLIGKITVLPEQVESAVAGLSVEELTTAVSPTEWSVAQIIHHLADSHSWGLRRCKMVLAKEAPTIASYHQDGLAQLADGKDGNIMPSLAILKGTHARWVTLLQSLSDEDWQRTEVHIDYGAWQLIDLVGNYARHGESHLQQIKAILAAQSLS